MSSYRPVFIMGAPRSGTTLLASMLSARNDVISLPEMHYFYKLLHEEVLLGKINEDKIINTLKNNPAFVDLNIASTVDDIKNLIDKCIKNTFFNIISKYNECYHKKSDPTIWIEHSPNNHKYYNILIETYPDSKFVHIIRDGRAVFSSTKKTDWGYKDVTIGAIDWRRRVSECVILENLYRSRVLTVQYEDIVNNTKYVLQNICDFVSMEFKQSMIKSGGIISPTFSRFQKNSNTKPHSNSIKRWKEHLKIYEIGHFNSINSDLLIKFGYETEQIYKKELKGFDRIKVKYFGLIKEYFSKIKFKRRHNSVLK